MLIIIQGFGVYRAVMANWGEIYSLKRRRRGKETNNPRKQENKQTKI
jgi:hypothetical protein